jgi:hypothetical protein
MDNFQNGNLRCLALFLHAERRVMCAPKASCASVMKWIKCDCCDERACNDILYFAAGVCGFAHNGPLLMPWFLHIESHGFSVGCELF